MAHEEGIVTSASLMVRYPSTKDAAAYAKMNPTLGVGLHIDLGEWIFRNGDWSALYELVPLDDIKAVEAEIDHQLETFYRIMGRKPTHIDSHQHVHQRESLRPVFTNLARKLDITLRACGSHVKYCGDFYGQLADGSPFHSAISVDGLCRIISSIPGEITELACHPGLQDDIETMYRKEREIELNTLCDIAVRELISDTAIELCTFEGISF